MSLKLEILPSFLNSCCFEIKDKILNISIKKIEHTFVTSFGNYECDFEINNTSLLTKINDLSFDIIHETKKDNRLILDGVTLICSIENKNYKFRCPEINTKEFELIHTYFKLLNFCKKDLILTTYIECLKDYFY